MTAVGNDVDGTLKLDKEPQKQKNDYFPGFQLSLEWRADFVILLIPIL
jgi:hypothetical protein